MGDGGGVWTPQTAYAPGTMSTRTAAVLAAYTCTRQVYCEMGLNGGGYTFFNPPDLTRLTNADVQQIFTDNSSCLVRIRCKDSTQPWGVMENLPEFR